MEREEVEALGEALPLLLKAAGLAPLLLGKRYAFAAAAIAAALPRPQRAGGNSGRHAIASIARGLHILLPLLLLMEEREKTSVG